MTKNNNKIIDIYDKRLSFVIIMTIFFLFLVNLSDAISLVTHISSETVSLLLKMILCVLLLLCTKIVIIRFNFIMFKVIVATIVIVIINALLFPQNNIYFFKTVITFFVSCFPLIMCVLALNDYSYLLNKLLIISFLITGIAVIVTMLFLLGYISYFNKSYSMGFSYSCLLPSLILFRDYICNRRGVSLVSFLFLLLIIVVYGSRGAILCIMVYFSLVIIRKNQYFHNNKTALLIFFILAVLIILCYKPVLYEFNILLNSIGINSRTITMFLQPALNLSGREIIYTSIINDFSKNIFIIRGINADYLLLGIYSHNFILELLYEFGVILGGVFALKILYHSVVTIFYHEYNDYVDLLIIFFSCSVPSLCISGTIWTNVYFWLWVVMCGLQKYGKHQ